MGTELKGDMSEEKKHTNIYQIDFARSTTGRLLIGSIVDHHWWNERNRVMKIPSCDSGFKTATMGVRVTQRCHAVQQNREERLRSVAFSPTSRHCYRRALFVSRRSFVQKTHWVPRRQWQNECEEIYSLSNVNVNSILFKLTIFDENNSNTLCIRL